MKRNYLTLLSVIFLSACTQQTQDLRSTLYEPYPNVIFDLDFVNESNKALAEAFKTYEKKEYDKALQRFEGLTPEQKTPEVMFYTGMTLFALKKYDVCKGPLSIGGNRNTQFSDAVKYYTIIADYEIGKKEKAFERLKLLLVQNKLGNFTEKGKQLLELLAEDETIPHNRER